MASKAKSIQNMPDDILLKIMSHFSPEEICVMADVCKKLNDLSKDKTLWKTLSYKCDRQSDISHITKVRCTALLGFRTN
jgi:hypothetical protein